ncbi:MAG: ATP-binding protein [Armatimonadetes bacterium]|nr:ATP-binding protein [Armatimonadota bacterium]
MGEPYLPRLPDRKVLEGIPRLSTKIQRLLPGDSMTDSIGKVTATERAPTTTTELAFWVKDGIQIRPFDIIRVKHLSNRDDRSASYSYAIINELHFITDSSGHLANFVSSDFGDVSAVPLNERLGTTLAFADVLYNDQDVEMPVRDGATVEWADEEGILRALGISNLRKPVPAGFIRMSNGTEIAVHVDADYLIGPEGAHLNIAGISGLATKTSYAMFLMNSLQQLQEEFKQKYSMIVFNVKGRDLLHLDEPLISEDLESTKLDLDQVREDWKRCNLRAKPFENVQYLYPYDKDRPNFTTSHADGDSLQRQIDAKLARNYHYPVERGKRKLGLLFSDIEDANSTLASCIDAITGMNAATWKALRTEVAGHTQRGSGANSNIQVGSWRRVARLIETRTKDGIFADAHAEERRLTTIEKAVSEITPGQVLVIDIEPLPPYLQALVVGDVIQTILALKLGDDEYGFEEEVPDIGKVIIFADELNKYAPRNESHGILTSKLREISARGRSLGMILFGAEQFRSGVDDQILGNCGTNVYGRTSPVEVAKGGDYKFMSKSNQSTITGLPKGSLMLQHAVYRAPLLKVSFPFPFYHQPKD